MKKVAAVLVLLMVITGCANLTAKDCAKYTLQFCVGTAVMAATGVDIMDYDPLSTNAILADIAVDSSMALTGYAFDEMTEPDCYSDQAFTVDEIEYPSEVNLVYIEYPPYDWANKVGYIAPLFMADRVTPE